MGVCHWGINASGIRGWSAAVSSHRAATRPGGSPRGFPGRSRGPSVVSATSATSRSPIRPANPLAQSMRRSIASGAAQSAARSGQPFGAGAVHIGWPRPARIPSMRDLVGRKVERAHTGDDIIHRRAQLGGRLPGGIAGRPARRRPRRGRRRCRAAPPRWRAQRLAADRRRRNGAPAWWRGSGGCRDDWRGMPVRRCRPARRAQRTGPAWSARPAHAPGADSGSRVGRPSDRPTSR